MLLVFISYRRDDTGDIAGRIYDRLADRFGKEAIFFDVDSIPPGVNFKDYLEAAVSQCIVEFVLIGKNWINSVGEDGKPRLENPDDFVRIEIETALNKSITVIPLLVLGAAMPTAEMLPASLRQLVYQNGIQVRRDPDFHNDMDRAITAVERQLALDGASADLISDQPQYTKAIGAIQSGSSNFTALDEFLETLPSRISELAKDYVGFFIGGDRDAEALGKTQQLTLEFALVAQAVANANSISAATRVFDAFAKLVDRYEPVPSLRGNFHYDSIAVAFRLLGHDWFTLFVSLLLKGNCLGIIAQLLKKRLYITNSVLQQPEYVTFRWISQVVGSPMGCEHQKNRAQWLRNLHGEGELGKVISVEELADADIFLALTPELPRSEPKPRKWICWSFWLLAGHTPPVLVKAKSEEHCKTLISMIDVADTGALRTRIATLRDELTTWLHQCGDFLTGDVFGNYNPDEVASRS